MRAKRGSKPTAANVIKAMVIFRNMLIPWKRSLPKAKTVSIAKLFHDWPGGLQKMPAMHQYSAVEGFATTASLRKQG
jgi:hypothetical protein